MSKKADEGEEAVVMAKGAGEPEVVLSGPWSCPHLRHFRNEPAELTLHLVT